MGAQVQAQWQQFLQPLSVSVSVSGSWLKRVVSG